MVLISIYYARGLISALLFLAAVFCTAAAVAFRASKRYPLDDQKAPVPMRELAEMRDAPDPDPTGAAVGARDHPSSSV